MYMTKIKIKKVGYILFEIKMQIEKILIKLKYILKIIKRKKYSLKTKKKTQNMHLYMQNKIINLSLS